MVNQGKNIKDLILQTLYNANGKTVSGVTLSSELNISRVAVWKHIKALKQKGYDVESSARGYFLSNPSNLLLPFCFNKVLEPKIFHFNKIETTMDQAKELAAKGAPHLSVVIAEQQNKGRGRLDRKWFSPKGGLLFTIILKPDLPPPLTYILNFAASLSLAKSLKKRFKINVSVKWPNDLLYDGKKLAGLLSEMETRSDMVQFVNIGIGLNVNNDPTEYEPNSISIKKILNKAVSRKDILTDFLSYFENLIENIDPKKIIAEWKKHTSTIGQKVRIETFGSFSEGVAIDVDSSGALLLKENNGNIKQVIYGDCFHKKER